MGQRITVTLTTTVSTSVLSQQQARKSTAIGEHEDSDQDSDHSYLPTVLLPPGEDAAPTISAHQCVEIFAVQTFRCVGYLSSQCVLPHES